MQSMKPMAALVAVSAVLAILSWAWQSQLTAPDVQGQTAFSRVQAMTQLGQLIPEDKPHPAGSDLNRAIRDRIVMQLRAAGYEPEIQAVMQCAPPERGRVCAKLENIIAVLKGSPGGDAILATAHYDSVPAGPGVGDDLAGTMVMLQLARHMKSQGQPKNDVIFLITDAEEIGLLGAAAFAARHPLYKSVRTIVNLEARGASGPSTMFETGPGNLNLIRIFAGAVHRPVADSVAYEIYKLLPNDTDFSIYRRDGLTGFNFAFTGSAARYHSPTDDVANLDQKSLQHHGDNAFALVGALANADLAALRTGEDASYHDVFGRFLIHWPSALNLPLAIASLLAVLALIYLHRAALGPMSAAWAVFAIVATPLSLFGMGWLLAYPLGVWPAAHPLDHANPLAGRLALSVALIMTPMLIAAVIASARKADARLVTLGVWMSIAAAAVACATFLPGATHAFVFPVMIFSAVAALAYAMGVAGLGLAAAAGFVAAAFYWMSYFTALEVVFGFANAESRLAAGAVLGWAMVAVFYSVFATAHGGVWRPAGVTAIAVAAFTLWGAMAEPYSPQHPRGANVMYFQSQTTGSALAAVNGSGPLDPKMVKAHGLKPADPILRMLGLVWGPTASKPAANLNLPGPIWTETGRETLHGDVIVRGSLLAARNGWALSINLPESSGVKTVMVEGEPAYLAPQGAATARRRGLRLHGFGDQPAALEFRIDPASLGGVMFLESSTLPDAPALTALTAARGSNTRPVHWGDAAIIGNPVVLNPQ